MFTKDEAWRHTPALFWCHAGVAPPEGPKRPGVHKVELRAASPKGKVRLEIGGVPRAPNLMRVFRTGYRMNDATRRISMRGRQASFPGARWTPSNRPTTGRRAGARW